MTTDAASAPDREERFHEVLAAYLEAAGAGWAPDRRQLLTAYPDFRAELEEFFATHDDVERRAAPLRAAAMATSPAELGQLGDYRLLREVGRGGMGVVYEAEQISLRRRVALKVLPFAAAIDPRQLQRFQNEALAAAHLRHEHVVPVYAVGSERGVHYYAMQFVEGQSLAALIAELRRLASGPAAPPAPTATTGPYCAGDAPETRPEAADQLAAASISRERATGGRRYFHWAAELGRQAAVALEHAHQTGIIHRDIKPANLLLDPRGQLWVADFGLAQFSSDTGLTVTGEVLGTLRYASPEQALAKRGLVDHRSDIYSLGATLYELLTLRPIFDGRDRHELLRQIAHDEPVPPRAVAPSIPVELETIVLKAVAKESGERYATAQDLADDLQRFREDRPIQARRPSLVEKTTKWARRHRPVVASVLVALVLSVAGLSAATVLTARAYERERQKAHEADESFRQARRAVDQLAQIGEEELAGQMGQEGPRLRLLEAALSYYQNFLDQRRDDASQQAELEASRDKVQTLMGELATLVASYRYIPLHQPEVQDELGLSAAQRAAIQRLHQQWGEGTREASGRGPGERERRRLDLARNQETEVAKLLTPEQHRRFKQIALQFLGPRAFADPDVAEALKLTSEQRRQIRAAQCDPGPPPPPRFGPRGDRHGPPEHPDFGRRRAVQAILALLTPEQQATWNELVGEPFRGEFHPPRPGPGPFPPNGPMDKRRRPGEF